MSLPQEPVFSLLKEKFVVGWKNIRREDYVGASHGYTSEDTAVGTTNGAGPRNMQTFILSPDGVVLHCLPGFWHPEDLAHELQLGRVLYRLWKDKDRDATDKRAMFVRMHKRAIRTQPDGMAARSGWQGFDAQNEKKRLEHGPRDTFYYDRNNKPAGMKPLSVLVHERMAARPFVAFKRFDTEEYIDYGRPYYDNNGGGVSFNGSKGALETAKRMADRRKEREERKAKTDAYYGKKPKDEDDAKKPRREKKQERKTAEAEKAGKSQWGPEKKGKEWGEDKKRGPTSRPTSRPSRRAE